MKLIDSHCHLSSTYYSDLEKVISESEKNGIKYFLNVCCEMAEIEEGLKIVKKHENIFLSLGLHPSETFKYNENDLKIIKSLLKENKKIIALGEIGLDYHYIIPKEEQQELFKKQLDIAEELNKPIIIHMREATKDTIDLLKKYHLKGIIHCYSGSLETAKELISMGYLLGIGGVLTFKNSKLKETIKNISLSKLVLETDSPFLTPEPYRGKQNSPKYIKDIALYLANIKGVPLEEVEKQTFQNFCQLFDLPLA